MAVDVLARDAELSAVWVGPPDTGFVHSGCRDSGFLQGSLKGRSSSPCLTLLTLVALVWCRPTEHPRALNFPGVHGSAGVTIPHLGRAASRAGSLFQVSSGLVLWSCALFQAPACRCREVIPCQPLRRCVGSCLGKWILQVRSNS